MNDDELKIISDGALVDDRAPEARAVDYKAEDVMYALGAVPTFQHPKVTSLTATVYSQEYVSDCVPHGFYTQLEYEGIVPAGGMSQLRAYRKRSNYPGAGSNAVDLYTQIKDGQSPNAEAPTQRGMTEAMANAMEVVKGSKLLPEFNYYGFSDYSLVPQVVASGKAVAVFIYATRDEWSREYVTVANPNLSLADAAAEVRHCICLVPNGDFTENGDQWLTVHDSAAFGGLHLRYINLAFLLKRAFYASKVYKTGDVPPPAGFHYTFTKYLRFQRPENDPVEVNNLQKALQFLKDANGAPYMTPGVFGPFGPRTKDALGRFQTDSKIKDPDGQGTNFGPQSRAAMNAKLAANP